MSITIFMTIISAMIIRMAVGTGAGLAFMPLLTLAMAHVPSPDAGLASGIINTSLQMSAAIGVAVLGTVATDHTRLAAQGVGHTAALLGGYHLAFTVGALCVGAAVIAALIALRQPRRPHPVSEPVRPEHVFEAPAA